MEYIFRFNLKPEKSAEFRQWLLDNHANIEAACPEGWTYLGSYFTVRGFGDHDCESRWALTDYAALAHSTEAFAKLGRKVGEFSNDAQRATGVLLKSPSEFRPA